MNIADLKKRIIYRSQYRGTKEMDKLLSAFVYEQIEKLDQTQLLKLEEFLNIDDENLYKFYNGLKTEINFKKDEISELFKNFKYKKK
tara:strand:+ start:2392 stop:2652 length:261 start_codon:yes stop_codon:yes gene_type:complete